MLKNLVLLTVLLSITRSVLTEPDAHTTNYDSIDPVYDEQQDQLDKDQDKRTIFSPTYSNFGLAKHVGYGPHGTKHVLGYSPVDLKFVPVVKPLKHAYHYGRPKIHLKHPVLFRPRPVFHTDIWKPVKQVPIHVPPPVHHHLVKPVVALHKPIVDHVHVNPVPVQLHQTLPVRPAVPFRPVVPVVHPSAVPHVDVHPASHVHLDHLHPHVDHVHLGAPAVAVPAPVHPHVDHVHLAAPAIAVPGHVHSHVDHVHLGAPAVAVPSHVRSHVDHVHLAAPAVVPQVAAAPLVPAFKPSPLFEVTRPDLGVLPLGTAFQTPVLNPLHIKPAVTQVYQQHFITHPIASPLVPQLVPQPVAAPVVPQHLHPVVPQHLHPVAPAPVASPVVPQHLHPVLPAPAVSPVVPQHLHPVVPQPVLPRPVVQSSSVATSIEYHGTYHPTLVNGQVPADLLPTVPNPVQNFFAASQPQPVLPTDYNNIHSHNIPQQPQDFQQIFHPQIPVETQTEASLPQNFFQQQLPDPNNSPFIPQQNPQQFIQQLPESTAPHYFSQTVQDNTNGYLYNQPQEQSQQLQQDFVGQNVIQPGQTDLQLPLHLPQHTLLNSHQYQQQQYQDQISQQSQNVFKPSLTLEPPFNNRRSSDDEKAEDYDDEEQEEEASKEK